MSKHTPGPWTVEDPMGDEHPWIVEDGKQSYEWRAIASVHCDGEDIPIPEAKANARLIAAAPKLLEACRKLANEAAGFLSLSDIERHGVTNSRILRDRIEQARDVIAKAEGRS